MSVEWLEAQQPAANTREAYLEFFGIAAQGSPDDLAQRIAEKRGYWRRRDQSTNKKGRATAQAVLRTIQDLSEALDNGELADVAIGGDVLGGPVELPADPEEALEILVARGELPRAVKFTWDAVSSGANQVPAARAFLYAIDLYLASGRLGLDDATLGNAKRVGRYLIDQDAAFARNWESYLSLLERTGDTVEMTGLADKMRTALGYVTGTVEISVLRTRFAQMPIDEWITRLVELVDRNHDDLALRGQLVRSVVERCLPGLLPLSSAEDASRYRRYVDALAWAADNIFEAEAAVRPHRLWAARCETPVNPAKPTYRTLITIGTGGLYLLWNKSRCKPMWQLYISDIEKEQEIAQTLQAADYLTVVHAVTERGVPGKP